MIATLSPEARMLVTDAVERMMAAYDEDTGFVLTGPQGQPALRETLYAALGLLILGTDDGRAARMVDAVLDLQLIAPGEIWHGCFRHRPQEAPPPPMPFDWRRLSLEGRYFADITWERLSARYARLLAESPLAPGGREAAEEALRRADLSTHVTTEKAAKIRKTEEKAKTNMLTKQKYSFDSNGKLANCISKDASKCEIFIVEGDSAGGSAKMARDRNYQAILPIRGKILNVEKASIDKVLANAEIKTMINAFGCGFSEGYGNDFDINKLRYDKIIIMADADVDGEHIATLLLTLFYRFMPELIYQGHVYIAMPPLYKAMPARGKEEYLYDDNALVKYRNTHKGNFTLQRYKGLGEMDPEQLWETTLDPERRLLKAVEIEDAKMASQMTELLMGVDVPPRREFIHQHATDAELDI